MYRIFCFNFFSAISFSSEVALYVVSLKGALSRSVCFRKSAAPRIAFLDFFRFSLCLRFTSSGDTAYLLFFSTSFSNLENAWWAQWCSSYLVFSSKFSVYRDQTRSQFFSLSSLLDTFWSVSLFIIRPQDKSTTLAAPWCRGAVSGCCGSPRSGPGRLNFHRLFHWHMNVPFHDSLILSMFDLCDKILMS